MEFTIKELMNGNNDIVTYYKNAKNIWDTIDINDVNLRTELKDKQTEFEQECGGRGIGQEIMAWSGIMQYIEQSDRASAQKLYQALVKSNCSNEVKVFAKDAGKYFDLN